MLYITYIYVCVFYLRAFSGHIYVVMEDNHHSFPEPSVGITDKNVLFGIWIIGVTNYGIFL